VPLPRQGRQRADQAAHRPPGCLAGRHRAADLLRWPAAAEQALAQDLPAECRRQPPGRCAATAPLLGWSVAAARLPAATPPSGLLICPERRHRCRYRHRR